MTSAARTRTALAVALLTSATVALGACSSGASTAPSSSTTGSSGTTADPAPPTSPSPGPASPEPAPPTTPPTTGEGRAPDDPDPEPAPAPDGDDPGAPERPGSTGRATVEVVPEISWAGVDGDAVVVNAYAPVVETGGTCTLELSDGSAHGTSADAPSSPDASVTWCAPLRVAVTGLGAGPWSVRVVYRSAASEGSSPWTTVETP